MAFLKNSGDTMETIVYSELVIKMFDRWLNNPQYMDDLRGRKSKEVVRMIREKWENIKRGKV